eukprot:9227846-Alexandrium_andersonii.AAC.1
MDTAGWVAVADILATTTMQHNGFPTEEDFRVLVEMENFPKARFLMAWQGGRLYIRAAQGHSDGTGD